MKFFSGKNFIMSYDEWLQTEHGKKFMKECELAAEAGRKKQEEFQAKIIPERAVQLKWFKLFFVIFFLGYILSFFIGIGFNLNVKVIFYSDCAISLISLILFFVKPKFIKFPNCFVMPVIAFFSVLVFLCFLIISGKIMNSNKRGISHPEVSSPVEQESQEGITGDIL